MLFSSHVLRADIPLKPILSHDHAGERETAISDRRRPGDKRGGMRRHFWHGPAPACSAARATPSSVFTAARRSRRCCSIRTGGPSDLLCAKTGARCEAYRSLRRAPQARTVSWVSHLCLESLSKRFTDG